MNENSDQRIVDQILKHADIKNHKVLEIGCGRGRISSRLSPKTHQLIAIDPDQSAVNAAAANVPGVDFRVGSGEALDFPNASFDTVVFTLSLHHQDSARALREAARVLAPGGAILVIEPMVEGEVEKVFAFIHNENRDKMDAQESVINSGLALVVSEVFTGEWTFEDEDELLQSLFKYYDVPFDAHAALNIANFLGPKIKSSPIVLEDKMILQKLQREC